MRKPFYGVIPKNFDLEWIRQAKRQDKVNLDLDTDFIVYLLTLLLTQHTVLDITDRRLKIKVLNYRELNLKASRLKYVKYNYNVNLNWLLTNDIINRSPNYIVGEKSYSYSLGTKYQYQKLRFVEIQNYKIVRRIKEQLKSSKKVDKYNFLYQRLEKDELIVNIDLAQRYLDSEFSSDNYLSYLQQVKSLIWIQNGLSYFICNPTTDGRVHTAITNCPKKVRQFITWKNQQLVEIDISNSIPYFIYIYYRIQLYLLNNSKNIPYPNIIPKSLETLDPIELERYGQSVVRGSFYESFYPYFSNTTESMSPEKKRKYVKTQILGWFFSRNGQFKIVKKAFKEIYPSLFKVIWDTKKSAKAKDSADHCHYKKFSHTCFQLESKYILDIIAREFSKLHGYRIPIYSLHDCLITTDEHVQNLGHFMEAKFEEMLGLAPMIKILEW